MKIDLLSLHGVRGTRLRSSPCSLHEIYGYAWTLRLSFCAATLSPTHPCLCFPWRTRFVIVGAPLTLSSLASLFLRRAPTSFLDEAEHFLHNRGASGASLRGCSGSSQNAGRLPSGISARLRRKPHLVVPVRLSEAAGLSSWHRVSDCGPVVTTNGADHYTFLMQ